MHKLKDDWANLIADCIINNLSKHIAAYKKEGACHFYFLSSFSVRMVSIEEEKSNEPMEVQDETQAAASEEGASAADENNNGGGNTRTAQLAPLPLEWTQAGQCDAANAPVNQIRFPSEVSDFTKEDTEIMVVGTAGQKITRMGEKFYEEASPQLKQLVLRSHLIRTMEGLDGFQHLELLELYDNMVEELRNLNDGEEGAPGRTLTTLDMSYNVIRDMKPVELCPNLTELCKFHIQVGICSSV